MKIHTHGVRFSEGTVLSPDSAPGCSLRSQDGGGGAGRGGGDKGGGDRGREGGGRSPLRMLSFQGDPGVPGFKGEAGPKGEPVRARSF